MYNPLGVGCVCHDLVRSQIADNETCELVSIALTLPQSGFCDPGQVTFGASSSSFLQMGAIVFALPTLPGLSGEARS